MAKEEILKLVDLYFNELVEDGILKENVTEEELTSLYNERKTNIKNSRFYGDYRTRIKNLGIAYSYLLNMIKNPMSLLDKSYKAYHEIIGAISEYGFIERDTRTTGQSENEAQEEIMSLISNFDKMLDWSKDILRSNEEYVNERKNDLEPVILDLEEQARVIREAASIYHNNLVSFRNGIGLAGIVGKSKRAWRKERNTGLHKALDFIREIRSLAEGLVRQENKEKGIRIKDYTGIPVNVMFINNIKKIKRSGVYYSFLSSNEKEYIEKGISL